MDSVYPVGQTACVDGRNLRAERTRRGLLRSGARAFSRHGYAGASLRGIARDAGLSQPGIYHHFATKKDLYLSVLLAKHETMFGWIRDHRNTSSLEAEVLSIFRGLALYHRRHPDTLRLLFALATAAPADVNRAFSKRAGMDFWKLLRSAFRRHHSRFGRVGLLLLNDVLRSTALGLAAPTLRESRSLTREREVRAILGAYLPRSCSSSCSANSMESSTIPMR